MWSCGVDRAGKYSFIVEEINDQWLDWSYTIKLEPDLALSIYP